MPRPAQPILNRHEFEALHIRLRRTATPGPDPDQTAAAAALVRSGAVVSAGEPPPGGAADRTGAGSAYRLQQWRDHGDTWHAVNDRIEMDIHGSPSMTHIDALSHLAWHAEDGTVEPGGGLDALTGGMVGRGVLVDVPRILGCPVPGGSVVTPDDLAEALSSQGVEVRRDDALWLRFGRESARSADEPLGGQPTPGLSIACADWLAEVSPAVVITDFGLDGTPSEVEGIAVPWHILTLTSLRIPLVDMANLTPVADACAHLERWEFLSVLAPLNLPGASGSPVNPLAIF